MVYIPLLHQPTHFETPSLSYHRSPRSTLLQFSSSSWTSARFSLLNQSLLCFLGVFFFLFYTFETGLHNTNLTVADFGLKDRATQVTE